MAVAESAQDAYDVAKKEFQNHETAFKRLETSLPKALAALSAAPQETDNGNGYIFCDAVKVGNHAPLSCIRGAGHNGQHVWSVDAVRIPVLLSAPDTKE